MIQNLTILRMTDGQTGARNGRRWSMDGDAPAPKATKLRLFKPGENPSTKGVILNNDTTRELLEKNQRDLGFERVAIDYNHCTVPDSPEYVKGQVPAILGYGRVGFDDDGSVILTDIEWTPLGETHATNFEDFSPAVTLSQKGEVCFVHSVAFCPNGSLYDSEIARNLALNSAGSPATTGLSRRERMIAALHADNVKNGYVKEQRQAPWQVPQRSTFFTLTHDELGNFALVPLAVADGSPESEAAARKGNLVDQPIVPDARVPKEAPLVLWGKTATGSGFVTLDETSAALVGENQKSLSLIRVPLLLPEIAQAQADGTQTTLASAQIAATGVPVVRPGDGLYLTDLQWTDAGKAGLMEYASIIPNVWLDGNRVVIGLRSAMLSKNAGDGIVSQPWPHFLQLAAGKPSPERLASIPRDVRAHSKLIASFQAENDARGNR